jgi:hypothetical protein
VATALSTMDTALAPEPSDVQLCDTALLLLSGVSGQRLEALSLSQLLLVTCTPYCFSGSQRAARANRLVDDLARYLYERHALLRSASVNAAGLDAWAAAAPLEVLRTALAAFSRRQDAGGRHWETGPDLLDYAAGVVASVAMGDRHRMCPDLHACLCEAGFRRWLVHVSAMHRLADDAEAMFVAYLVEQGEAETPPRAGRQEADWAQALRGWLLGHDAADLARALTRAATHYRYQLTEVWG